MNLETSSYPLPGDTRNLSRRFSSALSLVVISILLVFSIAAVLFNYYKLQKELDKQLTETLRLAETSLPTAVWQMDYSSIEDILGAILINDAIAAARIYTEGSIVAEKMQSKYSDMEFAFFLNSHKFTVESLAVWRMGEKVGVFEVAISRAKVRQGVLVTIVIVLGLAVILCMAIIVTSMLITKKYIFTPLIRLESHAKLVAMGNLESNIEISGNDDFAQLAAALNAMALQLKASFDTLEQKVMERTADLYLAKTEAEKMSQHLGVVGAELQALLDNSPAGILFVNFDRVIQRVNPEVERITGYSRNELIGHTTRKLFASEEIFLSEGEKNYPVLRKHGFCQTTVEIQTRNGEKRTCYWRGRVIASDDGVDGVVWSLEDISRRLQMEEELLKIKKLESIGVLAGGIAHDFNNLLLAIIGNISLAKRISGDDSEIYDLLNSASKASERAKDLTAKLLTFSSGGEPVKLTESLPSLLEESTTFVLSGSNVKCVFDYPEDLWPVTMDRAQISQVIQNLVLNADQAMPDGGTVNITCGNILLQPGQVHGLGKGRYVRVSVQDQGDGINSDIIDKIFDPYFSTKEKDSSKGSGLGLSIVHSIISKHGGTILVDSSQHKGSTFTIYLPAMNGDASVLPFEDEHISAGRGRILVMDDEEMIREVVCSMLTHLGYQAIEAADGHDVISIYRENLEQGLLFDAVIMDLTIPGGMGGVEAIKRLLLIDPQARVIVSSGYSHDPVLDNYQSFGFCNIVKKPYKLPDLSRVLKETLAN
jgi:two-component system cell cycle sensor histidine kinase/response regulator CckA